jgi:hypothetical protein
MSRLLREGARRGDNPRAGTDVQPGWHLVALRRLGAGQDLVIVEQVLEVQLAGLEPGGVHVGQVVGHGVNVGLLALHAGRSREKRLHHRSDS